MKSLSFAIHLDFHFFLIESQSRISFVFLYVIICFHFLAAFKIFFFSLDFINLSMMNFCVTLFLRSLFSESYLLSLVS